MLEHSPSTGSFPAQAILHPSFGVEQSVTQYGAACTSIGDALSAGDKVSVNFG